MNAPWIALTAILCNVLAQLSLKFAGKSGVSYASFEPVGHGLLLLAIAFYGASFFLTARVLAVNPLSVASPVMAGATFLLIVLVGWLLLGEGVNFSKLAGVSLIGMGIVLVTRA